MIKIFIFSIKLVFRTYTKLFNTEVGDVNHTDYTIL